MADASNKQPSYNILGSSKLNTADGKNPPTSNTSTTNGQAGQGVGKYDAADHRRECIAAHDALEDRLRENERLARWRRE